jgi:uncharacterized protein (DUF305 family)
MAIVVTSCSTATMGSAPEVAHPHPPGEPASVTATGEMAGYRRPQHTTADARFMRDMIAHHGQALEMVSLVPTRSSRDDLQLLARRIRISQTDEIALMRRWLERRGESAPDEHAHHAQHAGDPHANMPGMLTAAQLAQLSAATGPEFNRLFLEFMIQHHEGALMMVAELFGSPGAGQESEVFQIASEIDGDQRIEISRMRALLNADS